jgi:hypothetical protein
MPAVTSVPLYVYECVSRHSMYDCVCVFGVMKTEGYM